MLGGWQLQHVDEVGVDQILCVCVMYVCVTHTHMTHTNEHTHNKPFAGGA
jgi:hypothetical protein